MKAVLLMPVGPVEASISEMIEHEIQQAFALPVLRAPGLPEPTDAWDPKRRQHNAPLILKALLNGGGGETFRLIAVTELDLYIPMLSFIFGQAQLDGTAAIVSLARLRQEFYGLPGDSQLLFERARKEVVHELGHTFGLIHCPDRACVMSLATNIRQVDLKRSSFCAGCSALLAEALRRATSHRREGHG